MTNLFQQILQAHSQLTGWCSEQKAITLASLVVGLRPAVIVEVGVWQGKSLIPQALALRETGKGVIYGVDPWKAQESIKGMLHPADVDWWNKQEAHDQIYAMFQHQLQQLKLQNVKVIRKTSDEFEPPPRIDLLHIDGNHGEQAIRDVQRYASKVTTGGIVITDDIGWTGGAVERSLEALSSMDFSELYRVHENDIWAVWQKR